MTWQTSRQARRPRPKPRRRRVPQSSALFGGVGGADRSALECLIATGLTLRAERDESGIPVHIEKEKYQYCTRQNHQRVLCCTRSDTPSRPACRVVSSTSLADDCHPTAPFACVASTALGVPSAASAQARRPGSSGSGRRGRVGPWRRASPNCWGTVCVCLRSPALPSRTAAIVAASVALACSAQQRTSSRGRTQCRTRSASSERV